MSLARSAQVSDSSTNAVQAFCAAAAYAAKLHAGQRRKGSDAEPYINHPLEVAALIAEVGGVHDRDVLVAAVLHDTIEDTRATPHEIADKFGHKVLSIVLEVSDDKTLSKAERKQLQIDHAPGLSAEAKLVKLADKISNIRDVTSNPPADWDRRRRMEYIEWGERVVQGLRGINQPLEELFDEVVLSARADID